MTTSFSEWFDPYNPQHIDAYKEFLKTGEWPKDFVPVIYLESCMLELISIQGKLAQAWINSFDF